MLLTVAAATAAAKHCSQNLSFAHTADYRKNNKTRGCSPAKEGCSTAHQPNLFLLIAVQALWRGSSVRLGSGRRKADMRSRLRQAALRAAQTPHRQLGSQTKAALQQLAAAKHLPQALPALATLSMCSQYSKGCCRMIAGRLTLHVALII